jgi:EAL domain-containing protein (putative c-di-GMP-specific phosphodiesterase class I)
MSVNLSVRQFRHQDMAGNVSRALAAAGLDPRHLNLEITESILLEEQSVIDALHELDALGVQFSIDDFGTGYSSLSYLRRFPIDTLKIDRSFVTDIPGNTDATAIAQAIIAMARSLGLRVVAEGVETAEQLAFLHGHGCDAMQGYFFSKPLPADELSVWLRRTGRFPLPENPPKSA